MSQKAFATGAISQLILIISAFTAMTLGDFSRVITFQGCWSGGTLFPGSFLVFGAYTNTLLLVSAFLLLVSEAAIIHHLRVGLFGMAGPVLGLLAAIIGILLFTTGFQLREVYYYYPDSRYYYAANWGIVGIFVYWYFFLGLAMAFIGAFFLAYRNRFPSPNLWIVTGVAYFFAGVFTFVFFLFVPTLLWLVIAFAGVIGTGCFLLSTPTND